MFTVKQSSAGVKVTTGSIDSIINANIENAIASVFDKIYPVGTIYLSINGKKPPIGTWSLLDTGRFLMSSHDTSALGLTGGAINHVHTTGDCTLDVSQIPAHNHGLYSVYDDFNWKSWDKVNDTIKNPDMSIPLDTTDGNHEYSRTTYTEPTGDSQPHNHGNTGSAQHIPPYITCMMFQRTA